MFDNTASSAATGDALWLLGELARLASEAARGFVPVNPAAA
jgi:hypothetical protein